MQPLFCQASFDLRVRVLIEESGGYLQRELIIIHASMYNRCLRF
jgi:hypothetical protein